MVALMTGLFVLVSALLTFAFLRPDLASRASAKTWILYGGLVMPSVVLLGLLGYAFFLGERLVAKPLADQPMQIEVRAQMWFWEFAYPDVEGSRPTRDVLHIPAGQAVDFAVSSTDVIHSFWIPRLGGKIDAIPGQINRIRLSVDRPGVYHGVCAEFCGAGHAVMDFVVEAHEPEAYEEALRAMAAGDDE